MRARVLIVEDDPDTAVFLAELMRTWGFPRQVASNGRSALDAMQIEKPDIVLLDLGLPHVTGWEVAKQAAADFGSNRPFVVVISGYPVHVDGEPGIDVHLMKPVDVQQLQAILEKRWKPDT
jgi:two-component system, chemotaxis family, CheB/CheR fusion protein